MPNNNSDYIICDLKTLPLDQAIIAASTAVRINPANIPKQHVHLFAENNMVPGTIELALLVSKYWGIGGVRLTVGFMETTTQSFRNRILSHMNAWGAYCNVQFTLSNVAPQQVRISTDPNNGVYWSYCGTDILGIAADKPTMNLRNFTMQMDDSEFYRVVRHETGHTLGFPHEHRRRAITDRIDRQKAIDYFMEEDGWSADKTIEQVLTPFEESALVATRGPDIHSIMCYHLPASIMKDGIEVPGGTDIDDLDKEFAGFVYPIAFTYHKQNFVITPAARAVNESVPATIYDQVWEIKLSGVAKCNIVQRIDNDRHKVTLKLDPDIDTAMNYAISYYNIHAPVVSPYAIPGNRGMVPIFQVQEYTLNASLGSVFDQNTAINAEFSVLDSKPVPYLELTDTRPNPTAPVLKKVYQGFLIDVAIRDRDAYLYGVGYEINLRGKMVFVRSVP